MAGGWVVEDAGHGLAATVDGAQVDGGVAGGLLLLLVLEVGGDVASEGRTLVGRGRCDGAVGDAVLMPVGWGYAAEGGLAVFGLVPEGVHFDRKREITFYGEGICGNENGLSKGSEE